jgi:hypothetical protein
MYKRIVELIVRGVAAIFIVYFAYRSIVPRILDIPNLIKWNVYRSRVAVYSHRDGSKDLFKHVKDGNLEIHFFFDTGVKDGEYCIISYLPHSRRAVMIERDGYKVTKENRNVGWPWEPMLSISALLIMVIFFNQYALRVLAICSLIYYPLNIYLYYTYGKMNGAWNLNNNDALMNIVAGIGFLVIPLVIYIIERFAKKRTLQYHIEKLSGEKNYYITNLVICLIIFVYAMIMLSYFNLL